MDLKQNVEYSIRVILQAFPMSDMTLASLIGFSLTQDLFNLDMWERSRQARVKLFQLRDVARGWISLGYPSYFGVITEKVDDESLLMFLSEPKIDREKVMFFGSGLALLKIDEYELYDPFETNAEG